MRRYGSVNVPITSIGVLIYGMVMAIARPSSFAALAYVRGPFVLMPRLAWAGAFIVAALLALFGRKIWAIVPLMVVVFGWALALMIAAATVKAVSPVAGVFQAIVAVELLVSVGIRGFRPRALARKP